VRGFIQVFSELVLALTGALAVGTLVVGGIAVGLGCLFCGCGWWWKRRRGRR